MSKQRLRPMGTHLEMLRPSALREKALERDDHRRLRGSDVAENTPAIDESTLRIWMYQPVCNPCSRVLLASKRPAQIEGSAKITPNRYHHQLGSVN